MPKSGIFNVANMPFNAMRENKILMKISEFTVYCLLEVSVASIDYPIHKHKNKSRCRVMSKITFRLT